jgi:hypothetical protein
MKLHHSNQTQLTRDGTRNMLNRKPFRTKAQREVAIHTARKVDGRWVSSAPVSYHK